MIIIFNWITNQFQFVFYSQLYSMASNLYQQLGIGKIRQIISSISDAKQLMERKLRADKNNEQRLPHSVCGVCLDKSDRCWLFSQSVQPTQQTLHDIFDENTTEHVPSIKIENEINTEVDDEFQVKLLAMEIVQTICDYSEYSNHSPSPMKSTGTSSYQKEESNKLNQLQPHERVVKEMSVAMHKCPECGR